MKWSDLVRYYTVTYVTHEQETEKALDSFMDGFIERYGKENSFDHITIAQVFRMAYCLSKNSNVQESIKDEKI